MHYLSILCLTMLLNCCLRKKSQSYIQIEVYTIAVQTQPSKLDPFKPVIQEWLDEDKNTGANSITPHREYMNAWLKNRDIQAATALSSAI